MADPKLAEGSVMRHVTVMSFTSSIGIMAIYLVDFFDIFFISLLGHREVAAAAGYASTLLFFVSAMNIGLSVGAGALIAQELGRAQAWYARSIATTSAVFAASLGIILPIILIPFLPFLISLLGAEGEVAEMARGYLLIVLPATGLSGMSMVFVAAIRANGAAAWAMYPSLAGALVNLVFDPLLIFGLGMDLPGAATATVLARIATFGLAFYAVTRHFDLVCRPNRAILHRYMRDIMSYSLPAVVSNLSAPVAMALVTRFITVFGPEAVAGMAIIGRLSPVVFSVVSALSGSIGAIIGQNYGAGRVDRVSEAYLGAMKFLGVYIAIAMIILVLLRDVLADAFGAQGQTREMLFIFCGPYVLIAFFNGALFISCAAFNSLGHPRISPSLGWAKSTIGLFFFVSIGTHLYGMQGLAYGLLLNAALFAAIANWMSLRIIRKLPTQPHLASTDTFQQEDRQIAVEYGKPLYS